MGFDAMGRLLNDLAVARKNKTVRFTCNQHTQGILVLAGYE
jgi:hypothetical protein